MSLPLVSAIIACKGNLNLVKPTVESVLKQRGDFSLELVFVHNNINKEESKEVEAYLSKLNRDSKVSIRYEYLASCPNANVARNIGIKLSKGESIAMLDADDIWKESHIATCLKHSKKNEFCFTAFYSDSGTGSPTLVRGEFLGNLEENLFISKTIDVRTSTMFFSRDLILSTLWDETLAKHQDWGLALELSRKTAPYYIKDATVIICTQVMGRMSAKTAPLESLKFADSKLTKRAKPHFLLSRCLDELRIGTFSGLKVLNPKMDCPPKLFKHRKKHIARIVLLCQSSRILYHCCKKALSIHYKHFVSNK